MHSGKEIDDTTKKPEIINFYNSTKGGVDTFDQLVHTYTVARKTRRWPLRFFYGILDQAGINSMILYLNAKQPACNRKHVRRNYLKTLGLALATPYMNRRLQQTISGELKSGIENVLQGNKRKREEEVEVPAGPPPKVRKQGRCALCPRTRDKKVKTMCSKCTKPVCPEHKIEVCVMCLNRTNIL